MTRQDVMTEPWEPFWFELVDDDEPKNPRRETFARLSAIDAALQQLFMVDYQGRMDAFDVGVLLAQIAQHLAYAKIGQCWDKDLPFGRLYYGKALEPV